MPIIRNGDRVWKDFEEYDFINGIVPWPDDYFKCIVDEYIEKGNGVQGTVGMAECHVFDAGDLNNFGVNWMERNFRRAGKPTDRINEEPAGTNPTN